MSLRIHALQHSPVAQLGTIEKWAIDRGHKVTSTSLWIPDYKMPAVGDFDWLVVLGGPLKIDDPSACAWVVQERALVKDAINKGLVVIGISVGAQILASAIGARVKKSAHHEIGFFPITFTPAARDVFPFLPESSTVMHGHTDTFDIPISAIHLASSVACENQGFLMNNRLLGLQFHLEWDEDCMEKAMPALCETITSGPFVQSVPTILKGSEVHALEMAKLLFQLLDAMVKLGNSPIPVVAAIAEN